MGVGKGPSGPSVAEQNQLAAAKAKNRRDEQAIALKTVQNLRASTSEGGLLRGTTPTGLSAPPTTAKTSLDPILFGRNNNV